MDTKPAPRLISETIPYVSTFVVDKRGDVWQRTDNGFRHRMYNFMTQSHPNEISEQLRMQIEVEDAKRLARGRNYNYWDSIRS